MGQGGVLLLLTGTEESTTCSRERSMKKRAVDLAGTSPNQYFTLPNISWSIQNFFTGPDRVGSRAEELETST